MPQLQENISLKPFNTFGIDARARWWLRISNETSAIEFLADNHFSEYPLFILGGGSNILLKKNLNALVLKNEIKGIETISETADEVIIKVGGGEVWHELVLHCIEQGWGGIENLSLIPGSVGAAPIQNIGAYGVELKDVFHSLEAIHLKTGNIHSFEHAECKFGYRNSVFKGRLTGQYLISRVLLRLSKKPVLNTSYGAINEKLKEFEGEFGIREVSRAVCAIRQSKLPNPAELGNAGSFFKNPLVPASKFENVKRKYPDMPYYSEADGRIKIPAGWLIEQCGWKGKRFGEYGVYPHQALVLVNYGRARGEEIFALSEKIQASVFEKFGIELEREVQVLP